MKFHLSARQSVSMLIRSMPILGMLLASPMAAAAEVAALLPLPDAGQLHLLVDDAQVAARLLQDGRSHRLKVEAPLKALLADADAVMAAGPAGFVAGKGIGMVLVVRTPSRAGSPMGHCGAGHEDRLLLLGLQAQRLALLDSRLLQSCLHNVDLASGQEDEPQKSADVSGHPWLLGLAASSAAVPMRLQDVGSLQAGSTGSATASLAPGPQACDAWIGDFSAGSSPDRAFRVYRRAGSYQLLIKVAGQWLAQSVALAVMPADAFRDGDAALPVQCGLDGDGMRLILLPVDSPLNPSAQPDRNTSIYPRPTPFLMGTSVGMVATEAGLYRLPARDAGDSPAALDRVD